MSEDGPQAPPGWYPHREIEHAVRYWDGHHWTEQVRLTAIRVNVHTPAVTAAHPAVNTSVDNGQSESASPLLSALIPGVGAAGLLMTNQSASLITGTGKLWVGAALALGAAVVGWAIRPALPLGVRVLVAILAAIAFVNVNDVESQLQDRSREITREMDDILNDFEDL